MSRIIVTGGSGFIGTNLVESLKQDGHQVLNIDVKPPPIDAHRAAWKQVDLLDRSALVQAVAQFEPEQIYHLAARTDLNGRSVGDYATNTTGVANLLEAARAASSLHRVIFASSRLVCRIGYQPRNPTDYLPTTPYGESKVGGEQLVRAARGLRFEWAIVRPTSIWGPWFHVPYRNFFDAIRAGRYLHPRGLRIRKSFGFVGNSVAELRALMSAPAQAVHERMFYLADYEPIEVHDWGERIGRAFGAPAIREVPMAAMRALARSGDLLAALGWSSVPLTSFRLDNLVTEMLHDTDPLRELCGPLPCDLDSAVAATVTWLRADASASAVATV